MHELGLTQALVDTALRHAQQAGARKINVLHVQVGALSGVVADSVRFYFDFVSQGTLAEGAQLCIEITPPRVRCRVCGAERELPLEGGLAGAWYEQLMALEPCSCTSPGDDPPGYELCGGFECFLGSLDVE
ncbi:MAG: hydrogenase maturation nickel metallochaperone HypA [Thermoflexales bacterium]|nr:hydrogenase maturation nickel metallochaperone HypA [Thermoflexales bacterium]